MHEEPKPYDLGDRTKRFALRIIRLVQALRSGPEARTIGHQLLRAGTSVGANYRAAKRGRSEMEFAAKMGLVEEELDECAYWMELLVEAGLVPGDRLADLRKEADELTAITVSAIKRTKARGRRSRG